MDRLEQVIKSSKRRKDYLYAVLFLDLDRFKVVNDSLGHLVGDQLLISVGERLVQCLRPGDTVARLGGDEFALLLEDIKDISEVTHIAYRIQEKLALPFIISPYPQAPPADPIPTRIPIPDIAMYKAHLMPCI